LKGNNKRHGNSQHISRDRPEEIRVEIMQAEPSGSWSRGGGLQPWKFKATVRTQPRGRKKYPAFSFSTL
jgi:hypothetical protein